MSKQRYTISQGFPSLGDPCERHADSNEEAELVAVRLRREISDYVASLPVPIDENDETYTYGNENMAWELARKASLDCVYGEEAGFIVADAAVEITQNL